MSVAFVDTETTGLDPELNPIWEIAVILPDGPYEGEHCWQVRVPPLAVVPDGERPADRSVAYISQWVLDNTGFASRYNAEEALEPSRAAELAIQLLKGRHIVGAVPSFDEERLRRMVDEHLGRPDRYPWHYHLIDVEAMAVGFLGASGVAVSLPWKSDDLSLALGVEPPSGDDRHTALADARWARVLYEAVVGAQ